MTSRLDPPAAPPARATAVPVEIDPAVPASPGVLLPGASMPVEPSQMAVYARWFVTCLVALLAATMLLTFTANPYGVFDHRVLPPVASDPITPMKFRMAGELSPQAQLVLLGNSRAEKYDATQLELAGRPTSGFNAAVESTDIPDAFGWTSYFAREYSQGDEPPHLIIALSVESFRPGGVSHGIRKVPQLRRQFRDSLPSSMRATQQEFLARSEIRASLDASNLRKVGEQLLSLEAVKLSLRQVAHVARRVSRDRSLLTGDAALLRSPYRPSGVLSTRDVDRRVMGSERLYGERVSHTAGALARFYRSNGSRLDPVAVALFEEGLERANAGGIEPTIFLEPINPDIVAQLEHSGRVERHAAVTRYLDGLRGRYSFELHDYSDVRYAGGRRAWLDGMHPTERTTAAVLGRLAADSPRLTPAP